MPFDILRPKGMPEPSYPQLAPVQGVRYSAEYKEGGKFISIAWVAHESGDWQKVLAAVRQLLRRKYNAATKRWEVPATPAMLSWLSVAGFPEPRKPEKKPEAPQFDPGVDPVEEQRKKIDAFTLDPDAPLIPGLRSYQLDFLKFASMRHGRLALGDEMGCIDGEALVQVNRHGKSQKMTLAAFFRKFHGDDPRKRYTLQERPWFIRCIHQDGAFRLGEVVDVIDSGERECVRVTFEDGRTLVCTPDHELKTETGWVAAERSVGRQIVCNGTETCKKCGNPRNNDIANLQLLDDQAAHNRFHNGYRHFKFVNPHAVRVVSVESVGTRHTYDVKVLNHANFLADGVVVHNCGKTVEALSWLVYAKRYPALIVVNAPTKLQWQCAYFRWVGSVPGNVPRVAVLQGKTPYMLEPGVSYIINWDILSDWESELALMDFKLLIGDEVQAIGNPSSRRSRAFRRLAQKIHDVIGMSGTPAMSKPAQFWPLLNILEPEMFKNQRAFLYRYCAPKHNGFSLQFNGASNVKELHAKLVSCMLRRTKDQVLKDLPPKVMEVVPLEVDARAFQEYKAAEAAAFDTEGTSEKDMRERVAGLLRTAYALKEKNLLQWVRDFLESGQKLLLFAWHRDVVDLLHTTLKEYNPAKIYGGMNQAEREDARKRFIEDGTCRLMVANIQSGGVGIDGFQDVCSNVAFAEFSYTPNAHRQAEDRLHRSGQKSSVTSYYLVAPGTVDMDAVEVLDDRAKMLDGVLDGKEAADVDLLGELLERRGVSVKNKGKISE